MIVPYDSIFLNPTKSFRQLSILHVIYDRPDASQHTIGRMTHLSSSMVNNYIKRFKEEKLITVTGNTTRSQRYHLTDTGCNTLRQSLLAYSAEIVQLYGAVKREIATILLGFYEEGIKTVVLFGAAETAEVVYAALKDTEIVIIGVVDSDTAKHGKQFNGLIIEPPETLKHINPDAVVITSFGKQEEIYVSVKKVVGQNVRIKKLSDITG